MATRKMTSKLKQQLKKVSDRAQKLIQQVEAYLRGMKDASTDPDKALEFFSGGLRKAAEINLGLEVDLPNLEKATKDLAKHIEGKKAGKNPFKKLKLDKAKSTIARAEQVIGQVKIAQEAFLAAALE